MEDVINDYKNDENEGISESPPSKKRRGGIGRSEKVGYFNEALDFILEISIQSLGKRRIFWRGLFMRPMMDVERRLTWSGTYLPSDMQINLVI